MAQPQGGLSQVSASPTNTPLNAPKPANNAQAFDADKVAAENIETQSQAIGAKDFATRALEERREQSKLLNLQIEMLKANLETRLNPPFDQTLMKTAAGFLKPTKTGSFGESLGYAADNAADEAEKQVARNASIDKIKMDLFEKQQGLNQQNLIINLLLV